MKPTQDYKSRFRILKGGKIALIISALLGSVTISIASPSGGIVTSGTANISQIGTTTNINQSTSKATINWNKFNIASNETVNFNQPDINSITLNRVTGNESSIINGALNATGQVWLLNSNGVLFGKNAKINTSGLLATTKNISDTDFNNNNYTLKGSSTNSVINLGSINIANSGYATLISNSVSNEGTIKAIRGSVHLVGASEVTINLNGNSMLNLTIDKGVLDSLVKNKGAIYANAGEIYLTTNAVNDLLRGVVNNTGVIEAQSIGDVTGKIELYAHGGEVQVGGTLKANDGFIETSGKDFSIADNTLVQTGNWLIDPTNVTIDSTLASSLQTQLASGNAQVTTSTGGTDSGDINVNSSIAWSANTLTLHADKDININATLNATSTAGLALEYAQTTSTGTYNVSAPVNIATIGSFSTKKGGATAINYTIINTLGVAGSTTGTDLQGINGGLAGKYVLGSNIDASATSGWNGVNGFAPIGTSSSPFTGVFDGLGHTISNLKINRPTTDDIGLFGMTNGTSIQNIGMLNVDIKGKSFTGGLVGFNNTGSSITNSYATGSVSGADSVGGLVGRDYGSTITNSYATASVGGTTYVGGLVGYSNNGSSITNSYATGNVSGISNSVGGLVGDGSHATESVTNSFWDIQTTGKTTSQGGTGLTTAQMKNTKTFFDAGWDLDTVWGRDTNNAQNSGYLDLRALNSFSFNTVLSATVANQTKVYDKTDTVNATYSKASIISALVFTGNKNAGAYAFTSTASDYGLTYATGYNSGNTEVVMENSGSATITKKALSLSGITASNKVYDALTTATATATLSGVIAGDTVSNTIVSTFDNKNVGTAKTVTLSSTLSGTDAGNYSLAGQTTTANITKKALSLSGITASNKVYDALTTATTTATLSGVIAGDTVSNTIASTFDTKNVATAKTVTLNTITLAGADASNYSIATGQTTTADITKKALSLSAISASNKVYDATTTATVNATLGGLISGDSVSIASTFDTASVGVSKTVTLNSLTGTDAGNYFATLGQTTTATITAKPVATTNPIIDGIISSITNESAQNAIPQNGSIKPIASIASSELKKLVDKYDKNPLLHER